VKAVEVLATVKSAPSMPNAFGVAVEVLATVKSAPSMPKAVPLESPLVAPCAAPYPSLRMGAAGVRVVVIDTLKFKVANESVKKTDRNLSRHLFDTPYVLSVDIILEFCGHFCLVTVSFIPDSHGASA
jgi:hypothetical protein